MDLDASAFPVPADRFTHIINGLCRAIGARAREIDLPAPLLTFLWSWLRRTAIRLARLTERVAAGTLRPPRPPRVRRRSASPAPAPAPARPPKPRLRLPRGRGWLVRQVGSEASCHGSQLRHLLASAEMAALLEAAPQARRLLNPVCRMLGVTLPPAPRRPPPAPPPPTARDAPASTSADAIPDAASPPRPMPDSDPGSAPLPARHACGPPPLPA